MFNEADTGTSNVLYNPASWPVIHSTRWIRLLCRWGLFPENVFDRNETSSAKRKSSSDPI